MWQASRVHGITTRDLEDAPTFLSLFPQIKSLLQGRVLIAHACGTEKKFLRAFPGQDFSPWVDSLTLARAALPELGKHRLGSLVPYLGDSFNDLPATRDRQWHDALYDAAASFCFVQTLVETLGIQKEPLSLLLNPNTKKYHALRNE